MPTEHGGWGLTLEPVVLGLLVAPGGAGVAIGLAAIVAFVARTPIKIALVDRHRHRTLARTRLAVRIAAIELAALVGLAAIAAMTATEPFWLALLPAAPLVFVELWFDMRSRSRRLVPELAGAFGIGSVAAAIVLADGGDTRIAAGLWTVLAARSFASIPFVRFQLQRAKRPPARRWTSDVAQATAVAMAIAAWLLGWLPLPVVAAVGSLGAAQAVLARVAPPKTVIVGVQQMVLGLMVVIATAIIIIGNRG